jgi:hypothetical protein
MRYVLFVSSYQSYFHTNNTLRYYRSLVTLVQQSCPHRSDNPLPLLQGFCNTVT